MSWRRYGFLAERHFTAERHRKQSDIMFTLVFDVFFLRLKYMENEVQINERRKEKCNSI